MSAAEMDSGSKMAVLEFSLFVNQIITEIVKLGGHGIDAVGGGFISVVLPDGVLGISHVQQELLNLSDQAPSRLQRILILSSHQPG